MRYSDWKGFYELNPFPGCNQLVVSGHVSINRELRGKGFGNTQHLERLLRAKELGYDCIICTVKEDNVVEKHILTKNGWTKGFSFLNKETGHQVEIWAKQL